MFETFADRVNATQTVLRLGETFSERFLIGYGEEEIHVNVDRGRIIAMENGSFLMRPWRFAIRAEKPVWAKFAEPFPPPGFHDILAFPRYGHGSVEGDVTYLLTHFRYVKAALSLLRYPHEGRHYND